MVRMFVLLKSRTSLKIGHIRSKTRSLGQILEKHFVRSTGLILSPIIMELGQNVYLGQNVCLGRVRKWVMSGQKLGH